MRMHHCRNNMDCFIQQERGSVKDPTPTDKTQATHTKKKEKRDTLCRSAESTGVQIMFARETRDGREESGRKRWGSGEAEKGGGSRVAQL